MITRLEKKYIEKFFLEHKNQMFYIANNIIKDLNESEDIVQQSFLKIIKHIKYFKTIEKEKRLGYAIIVTRNTAIDELRRRNKEKMQLINETLKDDIDIEELVINNISLDRICTAIKSLTFIYRDVLTLYYVYDLSTKDISKILNRNYNTIKTQLKRGRLELLNVLKGGDTIEKK